MQQALAAGSSSAQAADELAGLLSLMGLQPSQGAAPMDAQQQQQQPHHLQHHHHQQPVLSSGTPKAGMEVEGGTGPGPPPSGAGGDAELAGRVAAAEGASLVCPRCGGVVAAARFEVHCTLWCPALQR